MMPSRSLLLLALAPWMLAADLQLPTSFEIRKESQELLADLAKAGPGDEGPLLERAAGLLERHGQALLETADGALPLARVMAKALTDAGLDRRFVTLYEERAGLAEAAAQDDPALERVALGFPGTAAAGRAWQRLATRAWDRGRPGAALRALAASPPTSIGRDERLRLADLLAQPSAEPAAPNGLEGLSRAWSAILSPRAPTGTPGPNARRRKESAANLRTVFGRPLGEVTAVSDGQRLVVMDHLLGRAQGDPLLLGDQPLLADSCRPAPLEDGWVAIGLRDQRLSVVRCDRAGGLRWRGQSEDLGFGIAPSAPVILDGLVMVAVQTSDGESSSVRVLAWRLADGTPAWSTIVGQAGGPRGWGGQAQDRRHPQLAVHQGGLLLLGDFGRLVRLTSSGRCERIWTYRADLPDSAGLDDPERGRNGALRSDGRWAAASPTDAPGQLLLIDGLNAPVTYRGDGAAGNVLGVGDGVAWLGGNRLIALDLVQRSARWDAPLAATALQAGPTSLLISTPDLLATVDRTRGTILSSWGTTSPTSAVAIDDWLITVQAQEAGTVISAWGDPGPARRRLTAAAEAGSWNAAAALASLSTGSQQPAEALQWSMTALRLGAPLEYARKAAGLLRRQLEKPQQPEDQARLLAQFAEVARRDPGLEPEHTYWRGLLTTDQAVRSAAMVQVLAGPPTLFDGPAGVAVDLRLLAKAHQGGAWIWPEAPSTSAKPGVAWDLKGRRAPGSLVAGERLFSYIDGVLAAYDLTTGREQWWRRPGRPLLGVQSGDGRGEGVALAQVIPGSSAAAAGLQSGDILLRLNGQEMRSFTGDLMPAVIALGVRGSFTAVVRRGATEVTCQGTLGGELVAPVAADATTVLVWPTGILRSGGRALQAAPEGLWVESLDATTGARRWRQAIAPATAEGLPARPLLLHGLVILTDGPDLVARDAVTGAERWRQPALGDRLARARMTRDLLWLPGEGRSHLLDPQHGSVVAEVPLDADEGLVSGQDLFTSTGASVQRADLGEVRQAWGSEEAARVLAVSGDGVWAVSNAGPLILLDRSSGRERRRYGDWPAIHEHLILGDQVVINGQAGPERSVLAGINLAGGSVAWSVGLPPGLEVLSLSDDGQGAAAVVGTKDGAVGVLHLARDGTLRGLTPIDPRPGLRVQPLPDGALVLDDEGARRVLLPPLGGGARAWIPGPNPENPPGLGPIQLQATTGGLRLRWTPATPQTILALTLTEAGEPLAAGAVRTEITAAGVLTGSSSGSPWTVAATSQDGQVVIDLLTTRLAGSPVLIRTTPGPDLDPRWWWTRDWRILAGSR